MNEQLMVYVYTKRAYVYALLLRKSKQQDTSWLPDKPNTARSLTKAAQSVGAAAGLVAGTLPIRLAAVGHVVRAALI